MRLIGFMTLGLVALASAQSSSSDASSMSPSPSPSMSISPAAACLQKCGSADVCCQAACVNVPCPSQSQANATTECAAQCPQGNGTQEETSQYAACQSSCINSIFLSTSSAAAAAATGNNDASTTGTQASATGIDGTSASSSSSATGSAASSSSSGNSADSIRVGFAGAGLIGLIITGLTL